MIGSETYNLYTHVDENGRPKDFETVDHELAEIIESYQAELPRSADRRLGTIICATLVVPIGRGVRMHVTEPALVEEYTQGGLERVYTRIHHGARLEKPAFYALSAGKNFAASELRKLRTSRAIVEKEKSEAAIEMGVSYDTPEHQIVQRQSLGVIGPIIQKLSERNRDILGRRLSGQSYADIATAFSVPDSTIKSTLFRIRRSIRAGLTGQGQGNLLQHFDDVDAA